MPLPIYRLRTLLGATIVILTVVVVGMYVYARYRTRDVRGQVPGKISYELKQTANGFHFSKSDGKRTLFSVQADDVKEFKLNGRAELHKVSITLYGRDASRYDQISGEDFAYDPKTGEVTAKGDVSIDLLANPEGLASPDQTAPKELKKAIHLKTSGLVFNRETGDAFTDSRVEFSIPQASGWASGVKYSGKSNVLTLSSHIHLELSGANAAVVEAESGVVTNDPRQIVLNHPHLDRESAVLQADRAVFHLGPDNNVESAEASTNVSAQIRAVSARHAPSRETSEIRSRADQAELLFTGGKESQLRTATLIGNVHIDESGPEPMQGEAGRVILQFAPGNQLQTVHAADGAHLSEAPAATAGSQGFDLTAPVIDFTLRANALDHAETSGASKITITSATLSPSATPSPAAQQTTVVTAAVFQAHFAGEGGHTYPTTIHGAPDARIVSSSPGQPDRISTSDSVDATFVPQGGLQSVMQQGNVAYSDSQPPEKRVQAFANTARYNPSDQIVVLTGNPRISSATTDTTAHTIRMNRTTGEAVAENDVKTTYNDIKEQPGGALLASSSPIHITAARMTAQNNPGIALYTGNARLWQDANVITAPTIQFDRDRRFVTAQGTPSRPVLTTLVQQETAAKGGKTPQTSPIVITASQFTYADSERKAHYEGGVLAKGGDFSASSQTLDAYLFPRGQLQGNQGVSSPGRLEKMVALKDVKVQQPARRAEGQALVYVVAEDKFVLTGGPPSIFDAEHGKITGVSLTFFRRDDRVLVEGEASTPVVTETRVAR